MDWMRSGVFGPFIFHAHCGIVNIELLTKNHIGKHYSLMVRVIDPRINAFMVNACKIRILK